MECQRCLAIHGPPGCPAFRSDEQGKAVCVWCADGLPCAMQIRRLHQSQAALRLMTAIRTGMPEVRERDVQQVRRPREILEAFHVTHAHELIMTAAARKKNSYEQEESKMTITGAAPTLTAAQVPAGRLCGHPGCKQQLGPNNTCGFCRAHRSHTKQVTGNGHLQVARGPQAVPTKKPNGASRVDRPRGNGNGAQPVEERRSPRGVARIEERVQLLLAAVPLDAVIAAIPREDQAKLISAWLSGAL